MEAVRSKRTISDREKVVKVFIKFSLVYSFRKMEVQGNGYIWGDRSISDVLI